MSAARKSKRNRNQNDGGITMSSRIRGMRKALIALGACIALFALIAPAAQASFAITEFGGSTTLDGQPSRQAGEHADVTTAMRFSSRPDAEGGFVPDGMVRDVDVALPPGLIGNPNGFPFCTAVALTAGDNGKIPLCPPETQVGVVGIRQSADPSGPPFLYPIYNLARPANLPALLGFNYAGVVVTIEPHLRAGDYAVVGRVRGISQAQPLFGTSVTLWGVPADPIHTADRFGPDSLGQLSPGYPSAAPLQPFMSNPTSCSEVPAVTSMRADSWDDPGAFVSASFDSDFDGIPFITEGCDRLHFDPSASVQPDSHRAGEPTGMQIDVSLTQSNDPKGLSTAHLKKTAITFPKGVALSPSAANGQRACSLSEIDLQSTEAPSCPASSYVGALTLRTPLLNETLEGNVILAKPYDNPFGSLLAIYLSIKGPGFTIKIPGKVEADPQTGQLTATVDDAPQLPFSDLEVSLRSGSAAPLQVPSACGTYDTRIELTSWASPDPVVLSSPMTIDENCDTGGFSPKLRAGTANPIAGAFSSFDLQVIRQDGDQNISRIRATLPEGVLAKLAGVPLCPDGAAATGACPAGSQVGTTTVGAGPGPSPVYVPEPGKAPTAVYLAGPYKGAPYSLVVKVPAQAGPFDLGTVTVRNALHVDPTTTQVTAESDPLPQILEGIPISYRDVRVEVTRPSFTLNPTDCREMAVTSVLTSASGQTATPSARFQAAGCGELGFEPRLKLSLKGARKRTGHPALTAILRALKGEANIGRTAVILPRSQLIDNAHINNPCTRVQFNAGACPPNSVLGTATAYTPLLDKPLSGPVYFRSNGGERDLPDLVADLDGQIHVTLVGFIDSVRKQGTDIARVRTRFQNVPDAPVSKFVLKLKGGRKGLLQNSVDLCQDRGKAFVKMEGQNGAVHNFGAILDTGCGKR